MAASARARLLRTSDEAVGAVEAAVKQGDTRTALTLLRELGLLSPATQESIDPQGPKSFRRRRRSQPGCNPMQPIYDRASKATAGPFCGVGGVLRMSST